MKTKARATKLSSLHFICGQAQALFLLFLLAVSALLVAPNSASAAPATSPPRVLILDESVYGGASSQEAAAAVLAIPGCVVDIVTAANLPLVPATGLGGPTGYGFDNYRAFIVGDPLCGTSAPGYLAAITALNATKLTWTPVCSGNVILEGVDNALHASSLIGADKTLKRGVAFAVNDPTKTGFYYALSCYYDYTLPTPTPTLVPQLTGFGTFLVRNFPNMCFNDAHIVATHAVFTAAPPLTDAELSNWSCSMHEGFDAWPGNFVVLAIGLTNGAYTASDGSNGVPYILVRGEGVHVVTTVELGPPIATNELGTTHTVCATLATNVNPRVGVPIKFTISSGPNAVTNYITLTDSNGVACFTYTGMGGPGVDLITASYLDSHDHVNFSDTVKKIWIGSCVGLGCDTIDCQADGSYLYSFCVTNFGSSPLLSILLTPPAGVTFTPSSFNLSPLLNPGQKTNLTVSIVAPSGTTNICYTLQATSEGGAGGTGAPCIVPKCITLPNCCNRVITNKLTYVSSSGITTTYNYQITVQNISGSPVKFIGFAADQSCVSFNPGLINLTLPAYGGPSLLLPSQTRTLNLQVIKTAPCPGTNTFWLSMFNSNLVACCSTKLTLPPPKCVILSIPYDYTVVLTNTPVLLRAIPNTDVSVGPCPFGTVLFYVDSVLVGVRDVAPYEATYTPTVAGSVSITAVVTLGSGEVQTSDPAQLVVIAPGTPPDQGFHTPSTLSGGIIGNSVQLNLPTVPGNHYSVEYSTNLAKGEWKTIEVFDGDGSIKVITDPVTNSGVKFYRSVILP